MLKNLGPLLTLELVFVRRSREHQRFSNCCASRGIRGDLRRFDGHAGVGGLEQFAFYEAPKRFIRGGGDRRALILRLLLAATFCRSAGTHPTGFLTRWRLGDKLASD
jgi:hypothetical protein